MSMSTVDDWCRWPLSIVILGCYCRWLGNDHLTWRGGGVWFFSKNIFWFPMLLKKIFWIWWRKKKFWFRVFVIFWKTNSRFVRQKKNILTLVLSKKKFWTKQKNITPPLQVKLSVPYCRYICRCLQSMVDVDGYCRL